MKSRVLSLLKRNRPGFISGEEISSALGISRTAVWKHIGSLREDGYIIESHPRVGYRLEDIPDRLYPEEITAGLETTLIGNSVVHFVTTGSTNDVAKELAVGGASEGLVVIAEEQIKGRGRLGRVWSSPAGKGIWFSILLRPDINPLDAPKITLLTAVALAAVLRSYPGINPGIKWPNDLLIKGRKIAGILTEMSAELDRVNYVVVGIGININSSNADIPEEFQQQATSLYLETGKMWSRLSFLTSFLKEFEKWYLIFNEGRYSLILEEWKKNSVTLGRIVRVSSQKGVIEGKAIDLEPEGGLILEMDQGSTIKVVSGEVTFA